MYKVWKVKQSQVCLALRGTRALYSSSIFLLVIIFTLTKGRSDEYVHVAWRTKKIKETYASSSLRSSSAPAPVITLYATLKIVVNQIS